jgi:integrase
LSEHNRSARRPHGTGRLWPRFDRAGQETWYASWRAAGGRRVKRRIGLKRQPGSREGLTKVQAEAELRRLMGDTQARRQTSGDRVTVEEATRCRLAHAERQGLKLSSQQDIASIERKHLRPFFGDQSLDSIGYEDVLGFVAVLEGKGLKPKSIRNVIAQLSALFNFSKAPQRRWASANPCEGLDLPAVPAQTEIRYLTLDELDALVTNARPGTYHVVDRALYLTAALTGLRKGELLALRWRDVDWPAGRIRVRQSYVRGQYGTPKSKRSTRSVPMADEVGGELDRLFQRSRFQDQGDLVFGHPMTGEPLIGPTVTRRYRQALNAAKLDAAHRFHDLRHTFGTHMAARPDASLRDLQEWMGHKDLSTTQIYADYAPRENEVEIANAAFSRSRGSVRGSNLSETNRT